MSNFGIGMRAKEYDPLQTIRDRVSALESRMEESEASVATTNRRITIQARWREKRKRYQELRGFRARAIRALVGKLTFEEIGAAFGISRQRAEQIAKAPKKPGRPPKVGG